MDKFDKIFPLLDYNSLSLIQKEVGEWSTKNFGDGPAWHKLLGVAEEVGELCHAYLKREQGIRGSTAKHREEIIDAVGDILIYLLDFCFREGLDAESILQDTWARVSKRDWKVCPETG